MSIPSISKDVLALDEYAKFKKGIGFMEMGGDDHNRDGKYSFEEFKSVMESNQGNSLRSLSIDRKNV